MSAVKIISSGLPQPATESEWLEWRLRGIGASEASAVVGLNPYMNNQTLWELKTRRRPAQDIGGKACVRYGHDAEAPIRELFALDHPEFEVQYGGAFDMVRDPLRPWLFATLDGRLIERGTGRRGIYEGKTTEILRSMQMEKWIYRDDKVYRKDRTYPSTAEVSLSEYTGRKSDGSPNGQWSGKPATMIRKVALVQALREAFPARLGAMYTAEEQGVDEPVEALYTEIPDDHQSLKKEDPAKSTPDTSDEDAFFADVP